MKKTLLSCLALLTFGSVFSQYYGFENWTTSSVLKLDDYNTTADDYPAFGAMSVNQSTSPYSGNSIHLETVLLTSGDTMFGYFIDSDPDNLTGGQPMATKVDSVVGYYRYNIAAGDSALFLCIPKLAGTPTAMLQKYIKGSQSSWTRFAYYVGSLANDSIMIGAASSDGMNFSGVPGSWIEFDNIQIKNGNTATPIMNYQFENWTTVSWENPVGWMTSNDYAVGSNPMPAVKSTDKYSGTYALELNTITDMYGDTIPGMATNGTFGDNNIFGGVAYTSNPTGLEFYYKYAPAGNDSAWAQVTFKDNMGNVIGSYGGLFGTASSYTQVTQAISLPSTPDSLLLIAASGQNPGSKFTIDQLDLTFPIGENELVNIEGIVSYPNPATDLINIRFNLKTDNNVNIKIIDVTGKEVENKNMGSLTANSYNVKFNTSNYNAGVYFIKFTTGEKTITHKFIVK